MKIGTGQDVRRLDKSVIMDYGVDQAVLMENAAIAARETIERRWSIAGRKFLIVCGVGNNGGDGFALARHLYARNGEVTVLLAGNERKLSGGAKSNYRAVRQIPLQIFILDTAQVPALLSKLNFSAFDLIVDGLFGTGLSRSIDGRMAALINRINESDVPILALDIPSGIDTDSGEILGCAIQADATVSFGILKRGNLLYPGHFLGGTLYYSEISFPPEVTEDESIHLSLNIPAQLPERNPAGYKGSFGKVLIVGGSVNYSGAPTLAAEAALRAGAGYARLAVPTDIASRIFTLIPEAVFLPMDGAGVLGSEHVPSILEETAKADTTVLGPGLSTGPESIRLARDLMPNIEGPLILDGDALTALAGRFELIQNRLFPTVLTPHPGEMAKLLGSSIREVKLHRVEIATEAAERYQATVVLKGAHSIIAAPSGEAWINLTGNSGMGTAGSGDVLAGIIGALLAGDSKPLDAIRQGVYLHGLAGDLAAKDKGEAGMIARDIIHHIPEAMRIFPKHIAENPYSGKIIRL